MLAKNDNIQRVINYYWQYNHALFQELISEDVGVFGSLKSSLQIANLPAYHALGTGDTPLHLAVRYNSLRVLKVYNFKCALQDNFSHKICRLFLSMRDYTIS